MANIIKELTKDCSRGDCVVDYQGSSQTLMGWVQSYDKNGNPINSDPNITTSHYNCSKCGAAWKVESRQGIPIKVGVCVL
jgi:hypothetical protein